ncbi:molybdopterin-dependent oxidoreductase, partial [Dehalococcoidia bacterium]|nr:molybdopterin-dependent oxidoreductase [Dehalococcoidia bacterium]
AGNPRHPSVIHLKTGVKRDGTIVAHQADVIFNSGAYGGFKPGVNLAGGGRVAGPYRIPNVYIEATQVYTNTTPGGHYRAPGEPQAAFAIESHIDSIARQLGMDPLAFRLKNIIKEGDADPVGTYYQEVRGKETLEAAVEASQYMSVKPANVGRGMAIGERGPGGGESHAAVTLNPDGSVVVNTPIFEQGAGTYTTLRQIVAEELAIPPECIRIEVWNTDAVSFDTGMGGSRVTRIAGEAAYLAATEVRQELLRLAAELTGWVEEKIDFINGEIRHRDTGESRHWTDLVTRVGHVVTGRATHQDSQRSPVTSFTAQVAEVSVDPETGEVQLLKFTTAHDVGRVLNPVGHQGQINGGVMQGIGYALMEELEVEDGRVTTLSFGDYKIPTMGDIPKMRTVLLESESGMGPYKIKGIGENPIGPVAAAIANAVEDAVGVRTRDLPITAEKVYIALKEKQNKG